MARDELLEPVPDEDDLAVEGPLGVTGVPDLDELDELLGAAGDPIVSLRPRSLDEFVGQTELKRRLAVIL